MKNFLKHIWTGIKMVSYQWVILVLKQLNKCLSKWLENKKEKKSRKKK